MAGSAATIVALVALFNAEARRGERILLTRIRNWLDRVVLYLGSAFGRLFTYIGAGVFKVVFHYFVHKILSRCIAVLHGIASYLSHLQIRNKRRAMTVRNGENRSHLDEIAAHKEETSLTEAERRKMRSH